jgi:HAD superfamily phosphoserine phosphatase-like hydrolase
MADTSSINRTSSTPVAFFDLDRTIIGAISGRELAKGAFREGIMRVPDMIHGIFLSAVYKLGLKSQTEIINELVKWVRGMPEAKMLELCKNVSENILIPSIYKEAKEEIYLHRSKGHRIVILSSALRCVCEIMSATLEVDDILCSDLEVRDGLLTGQPEGRICFGKEKLVRFLDYCWKNDV